MHFSTIIIHLRTSSKLTQLLHKSACTFTNTLLIYTYSRTLTYSFVHTSYTCIHAKLSILTHSHDFHARVYIYLNNFIYPILTFYSGFLLPISIWAFRSLIRNQGSFISFLKSGYTTLHFTIHIGCLWPG